MALVMPYPDQRLALIEGEPLGFAVIAPVATAQQLHPDAVESGEARTCALHFQH